MSPPQPRCHHGCDIITAVTLSHPSSQQGHREGMWLLLVGLGDHVSPQHSDVTMAHPKILSMEHSQLNQDLLHHHGHDIIMAVTSSHPSSQKVYRDQAWLLLICSGHHISPWHSDVTMTHPKIPSMECSQLIQDLLCHHGNDIQGPGLACPARPWEPCVPSTQWRHHGTSQNSIYGTLPTHPRPSVPPW